MKEEKLLTLAIPTFNRRDICYQTVKHVFENDLHKYAKILVVDNCSPDGTAVALKEEFGEYESFRIVEQKSNVGLFGNILSLHQCVDTQYVCINSDEDDFVPAGVRQLCTDLAEGSSVFLSGSVIKAPPMNSRRGSMRIDGQTIRPRANYGSGLVYKNSVVCETLGVLEGLKELEIFLLYPMFATAFLAFLSYPDRCHTYDQVLSKKRIQSETLIEGSGGEKYYSLESRIKQIRSVQEAQQRLKAQFPASAALIDSWAEYEKSKAFDMVRSAFRKEANLDLLGFDNTARAFYIKKMVKKILFKRQ